MFKRHNIHNQIQRIVALLPALFVAPLAWSQQPLQVQEQRGVTFVGGGFGTDERNQLQAMQGRLNLKLVFATVAGNYLAGVDVRNEKEPTANIGSGGLTEVTFTRSVS